MKLSIPSVSVQDSSPEEIARAVESCGHGVLTLTGLPSVPFGEIKSTFDHLSQDKPLTDRLNAAYKKNLVYKDAFANHKGGPTVDMKRVLDLSPDRLAEMKQNDAGLAEIEQQGALGATLAYWENLRIQVSPKIVEAVSQAIGDPTAVGQDAAFNYRMVDYYERDNNNNNDEEEDMMIAPRCGEHRDFGSFTLVFPSHGGFQVFCDDKKQWMDVEVPPAGGALLVFGWCTQIRSNGRIPAVLHRVVDATTERRVSAVLFCAPKLAHTPLEPVVREGERPKYISGIQAGQLRGSMARKWQLREGTIKPEDLIIEEAEILATNMRTQDDVVQKTIAA